MSWQWRLSALVFVSLAMLAPLPGCGDGKIKIKGKLTKGGQPFTVAKDTLVTLRFTPDAEQPSQSFSTKFKQETGEFETDLPPGKYRVTFVVVEKDKTPISAPPDVKNKVYDLTRNQELNIDIGSK